MNGQNILNKLDTTVLISAIASTVSPLIITDNLQDDNPIVFANQAFLDLCGYSVEEIIGHNCRFLQGADSDASTVKSIRKAVDNNDSIRVNLKNYRKDGSVFWNDLVISPIKDTAGNTTHFIGMQLDITEQIKYTEKLEMTQKKLTRSNQELEQFTYAASHDLQEPLRMVSSYLQLLNKRYGSSFDDDAKVFIGYATEGADRMQALINDLLILSRVSSTARQFRLVSLNDIVERVCFNLKLLIEETKTTIECQKMQSLPVDGTQLLQLVQNLIGNAIKYRKPGTASHVVISGEQVDDCYIVTIRDDGIGIEPKYHDRIFTIFQRLHTRDEYPGTGVGLAICSKIVERHGGKLWVESNGKDGSAFKFSLPTKRKMLNERTSV